MSDLEMHGTDGRPAMTEDAVPFDVDAAILRARARAIARPSADVSAADASIEVLEFRLAAERYAIEMRHLDEVQPLKDLTPLPGTPPFIAGIVNVRGQVVTVLDVKRFFGLPDVGLTDLHRIVIVGDGSLGVLADATIDVRRIDPSSLQMPLPTAGGIGDRYVRGVAADGLVVLDIASVLADPRLIVDDAPLGSPRGGE